MPEAHFVGEITRAVVPQPSVAVTWAIVPGKRYYTAKSFIISELTIR